MSFGLSTVAMADAQVGGDMFASSKTWTWHPTAVMNGAVWGNGGYNAGEIDDSDYLNGAWWGCGPVDDGSNNTFAEELLHSSVGELTGEEYSTSKMVLGADGSLTKYDKDGNVLNIGQYGIENWNGGEIISSTYARGYLNTTEGAILWPYQINSNGYMPTKFEIAYMSSERLILTYAPAGTGSWAEATWWSFGSDDGVEIEFSNNDVVIDGVTYRYIEGQGMSVYHYTPQEGQTDLVIPASVKYNDWDVPVININSSIFQNAVNLQSVNLPETIVSIGEYAFANSGISKINMPEGVTFIGQYAFSDCKIEELTLPNGNCTIENHAVSSCNELQRIIIPSGYNGFTPQVLYNCYGLQEIIVAEDNQHYRSIDGALYSKDATELIFYPTGLTSIQFAEECTSIGEYSFYGSRANTVKIPDSIHRIGDYAFGASLIEEALLPQEQPEGCCWMFNHSPLKGITLPNSWTSIPSLIFNGANNLEKIEYGENVTQIGIAAISQCRALEEFEFKPTLREVMSGFDYVGIEGKVLFPEGIERIGYNQYGSQGGIFMNNALNVTEIDLPSTLTNSVSMLFMECDSIQRVVNFSPWPVTIANGYSYFPNLESPRYDDYTGIRFFNYYCLPGVGINIVQYDTSWCEWPCIEILSFDNISIQDGRCSFAVSTPNDEFEIVNVSYQGVVLNPEDSSRTQSQAYTIEGIGSADLCNIQVKIKCAESIATANIILTKDGAQTSSVSSAIADEYSAYKLNVDGRSITIVGAPQGLTAQLFTPSGKLISSTLTSGLSCQTLASHLFPGLYIARIGTYTAKLIVN